MPHMVYCSPHVRLRNGDLPRQKDNLDSSANRKSGYACQQLQDLILKGSGCSNFAAGLTLLRPVSHAAQSATPSQQQLLRHRWNPLSQTQGSTCWQSMLQL